MLINSFKPVRNLVLVKTIYKAKGMLLMNATKQVDLKVLDKSVVACGPDVTCVKPGDVVALSEHAFNTDIIQFTDNMLAIPRVAEIVKSEVKIHSDQNKLLFGPDRMSHNLLNPAAKEYLVVGYVVINESNIIGIVNSIDDEPNIETETKSTIILPIN